jgi:hypothetical protein
VAIVVPTAGNEVAKISLICKGVNRSTAANSDLAYSVRQFMTNSPSFTNAVLEGTLVVDVDTNTFTFNMTVDLKHHFKL